MYLVGNRISESAGWRIFKSFLPVILLYSLIFWLSDQPKLPGPQEDWLSVIWFKSAHLIVYGLLSGLIYRAWRINWPQLKKSAVFWSVLGLVLILAWLDEFHQSFVPGRTSSLIDVGIDMIGAGSALCLILQAKVKAGGRHE